MAERPRPKKYYLPGGAGQAPLATVYAANGEVPVFFSPELVPAGLPDQIVETTVDVSGHTRKYFPGDTAINVENHSRRVSNDVGKQGAAVTPGSRFWIEGLVGDPQYVVQCTYTGSWKALKAAFLAVEAPGVTIRRESGRSWTYIAPTPP